MRKMLLETGLRAILVMQWQKTRLNCSLLFSGWNRAYELEYLAVEISKQSVGGVAWFLLAAYGEIQEERDKVRKRLLSRKEPAHDLERFQLIQINCRNKTKGMAGKLSAKEIGMWLWIQSTISAESRSRERVIQEVFCLVMWTPMRSTDDQQGLQEFIPVDKRTKMGLNEGRMTLRAKDGWVTALVGWESKVITLGVTREWWCRPSRAQRTKQ